MDNIQRYIQYNIEMANHLDLDIPSYFVFI